jgi:hypothetical protein
MEEIIVHFDVKDAKHLEECRAFVPAYRSSNTTEPFEWGSICFVNLKIRFLADVETKQETVYKIRRF